MKLFKYLFDLIWRMGALAFVGLVIWYCADTFFGIYLGPPLKWVLGGVILGFLINIFNGLK